MKRVLAYDKSPWGEIARKDINFVVADANSNGERFRCCWMIWAWICFNSLMLLHESKRLRSGFGERIFVRVLARMLTVIGGKCLHKGHVL